MEWVLEMYVCLCKAVTQKQIEEAVEQGDGYAQVRQKLGVASDCGCCGQMAKKVIREHLQKMPECEFSAAG
jgi:bacterioferritin-associated ferredoxin